MLVYLKIKLKTLHHQNEKKLKPSLIVIYLEPTVQNRWKQALYKGCSEIGDQENTLKFFCSKIFNLELTRYFIWNIVHKSFISD